MRERIIEDLVYSFPEEFFDEVLKPVKRQMSIEGRRLDLLFEDAQGRFLLLEIKAGEIRREHVGQAGEYFGLLRLRYPERETRVALLGTDINKERRLYLETIGVEVYVVSNPFLMELAKRHGVDPEIGIPRSPVESNPKSITERVPGGDRYPVTDEASYFERVANVLCDDAAKEKLAAIYAVAKKSAELRISFSKAGSAEFTLDSPRGRAKLMKILVYFKRNPPKGTLTIYWKYMLKTYSPDELRPFAVLMDELLDRRKAHIYLDPHEKSGTFDSIDLHDGQLDGQRFARFLEGFDDLVRDLSRAGTPVPT